MMSHNQQVMGHDINLGLLALQTFFHIALAFAFVNFIRR